jgi:hypothetical protein
MRILAIAIATALMLSSSSFVIAQTDKPADAAPTAVAPAPAPATSAPATQEGTALKSAISTPGCYVKFLEAKIAGKLNGKKWTDYRRDVCGAHEITAVFPRRNMPAKRISTRRSPRPAPISSPPTRRATPMAA